MKYIANIITSARIVLSLLIIAVEPFTIMFYILYILCGLSDMLDGFVARKTQTAGKFGEKLDSIADAVFVMVCLIKLLPIIEIEKWIYVWVAVIAIIKVVNIVSGYVYHHRFVSKHTIANKITGLLMFLFPFTIGFAGVDYIAIFICAVAMFAAIQEGHIIRTEE